MKIFIRNILTVIIVAVLTSLILTVSSYIFKEQSNDLFSLFLYFIFPYSLLFVFLYGFLASITGEIIALLAQNRKGRFWIKMIVYGISLTKFEAAGMVFFAFIGIVAAVFYVYIDEYFSKRTKFAIIYK